MGKKEKHRILHFWQAMERGITGMSEMTDKDFTDESLRVMKRIYRRLRVLIVKAELAVVERRKEKGYITPKQARSEKAKVKRRWL